MSKISELVNQSNYREAILIPEESLSGRDLFLLVSAHLSLSQGKEALDILIRHRDELYAVDPLLTLKATFETRFLLKQFDEAEQDLKHFEELPYVSQKVEEALRGLKGTIAATRYASSSPKSMDYERILEILASPSDDLMLLSALNGLRKVGELEDYRGLVEELLVGPYHDDVKTYALMLLSAKGSEHEVTLTKHGKSYKVVPAKLGTPYGLPEYKKIREKIENLHDGGLSEVMGELLDLYALQCYPERFLLPGEEEAFFEGLLSLGHSYLGQASEKVEGRALEYAEAIEKSMAENPPLLG